ncbi:ABC transporter permease [Nitrospira sp. Nam74]
MTRALCAITRRHLFASPVRTALTVLGIVLGVAVAVAIQTANVDVLKSFEQSVMAIAGRATVQVSGGELGLDERLIQEVTRHPDVVSAMPVIQLTARVVDGPNQARLLPIMALDLLEANDQKRIRFRGRDGERPSLDTLLSPQAVFVGTRLAVEWDVHVGSELRITTGMRHYDVVVAGLIESDSTQPSIWDTMGIMDVAAAQMLFGLVGRLDRIDIITEPGRPLEKVIDELQAALPASVTVTRPASRTDQIERMTRAFHLNLTVLSMVSLLVGLFLVYNTVSFAVVRRRREIGMLSAMGMSRRAVTVLFMSEAATMGLVGGLLGAGCGALLAKSLLSRLSTTISDLYVSVDTGGPDVSLVRFVFDLPLTVWIEGAALGAIVSMVGALVPSWDAGQTAPAKALAPGNYEATQRARVSFLSWTGILLILLGAACAVPGPVWGVPLFGYVAALCLLLGLSCLIPLVIHLFGTVWLAAGQSHGRSGARITLPLVARLAADQISRAPGRNAVTISAMMVAISIMVGVDTMVGSFRETVREWIDQTVMADLIVAPANWLHGHEVGQLANRIPLTWVQSLSGIPGVAALDTYRDVFVDLKGRRVALVSRDLRLHATRSRYLMVHGNSATILNEAVIKRGVVVSEVLARTAELQVGDLILLATPSGEQEFPVLGIFLDYATDGGKIVMDRDIYQQLWKDDTTTVIPIYVEGGADRATVRRLLEERVAGMDGSADRQTPLIVISNGELRQEIMVIFDRTFTVTYVLELIAIIIAVLGIVNTLVLSVLQRRREFAMLRSIGATIVHVRRLMVWEAGYLGLLGGLLGVLGGMLLSVLLIEVINKQSFGWTIQFFLQPRVVVQALVLALGAAFIAAYIPAQWAVRQSIAEGLRYE